ncbi:hypothetical protein Tco_0694551 [Tanacetum coccineum]
MSNSNTNMQTQTSSVLQNDTVSSCSISKVQEKTQLSRIKCMNSLRAIQSQLKFLIETLQDFGNMHIFKRTFSQDLDLLENHLTKEIISQTDCKTTLTKLRTTFENAFNSELKALLCGFNLKRGVTLQRLHLSLHAGVGLGQSGRGVGVKGREEGGVHHRQYDEVNKREDATQENIRPIYDEEPMAEVQLTAECNIFAIGQQNTEQPEIINEFRNSSQNMPRFSSNDMVYNHYLDEAKKKIQERDRNSKTSVTPSARFQSTADDSKPKPRSNNLTPRSLHWIPQEIYSILGTSMVNSESPTVVQCSIPNIHECKQTLDESAGTSINVQKEQSLSLSAEVHHATEIVTKSNELDLLFGPLFDEYFNRENLVVSKSSAVTTADASDKRQQQPDSTSSTSTLATTITADGNFDL